MTDTTMTTQLEMRWLPVTDDNGRERMEAVWVEVGASAIAQHAA